VLAWYTLHTTITAPAPVAEWYRVVGGQITAITVTFDARPFSASMPAPASTPLAALTGYSVTTVGHAETGRLWQARAFWEKADLALAADGELTRRHEAHRAALADPAPTPRRPLR
jgi:hypothetical protein